MMITILGLSRERPSRTMAIKCVLIRFHSIRFHSSRLHSIRFDLFGPPLTGGRRGGEEQTMPIYHTWHLIFLGRVKSIQKVQSPRLSLGSRLLLLCKFCCCFSFVSSAFCFSSCLLHMGRGVCVCVCVWRQRKWGIYLLQPNYVEKPQGCIQNLIEKMLGSLMRQVKIAIYGGANIIIWLGIFIINLIINNFKNF